MAWAAGDLYGHQNQFDDYKIRADVAVGSALIMEATAATAAEVDAASTTGAADFVGFAAEDATYTATQSATMVEGTVRVIHSPFMVWGLLASGSATEDTALVAGTQILTNDTADTTGLVVTEADIGTTSFVGGLIKGRSGANAGQLRIMTAHNNNTNTAVTVPFPNDIAANDTFIRTPWSRKVQQVQLSTALTQADMSIATGTGAPFYVHRVVIDEDKNKVIVYVIALDHVYNPA